MKFSILVSIVKFSILVSIVKFSYRLEKKPLLQNVGTYIRLALPEKFIRIKVKLNRIVTCVKIIREYSLQRDAASESFFN